METDLSYVAFAGARRVAAGQLRDVLGVLKRRYEKAPSDLILVFAVETGRQVDFDLRGSLDEVLERYDATAARGPGRPRLGVTSREVSLLPRHWEWLDEQPSGISAALRRLVEHAIKNQPGRQRAQRIRNALNGVLTAIAGDRPHYEEATRALFAGDTARFETLIERWPRDIREFAVERFAEADRAEHDDSSPNMTNERPR
ncbi:MAG TPA: DUF2239 family protein [Polyangiaceae bacterium]|nr:DUF2239 family protein [Polyangiaceae bacterium]